MTNEITHRAAPIVSQNADWRLIEGAPRDGTRIWLWLADEDFGVVGIWKAVPDAEPDEEPEMWWMPEMDFWQTDTGLHQITHWMPLPKPPQ